MIAIVRKCIIYCRFSPRPNADDCESNELQLQACQEYAADKKMQIMGEFEDRAESGGDEERPGLWEAVESCMRGWVLLSWKQDRLYRSVYLGELIRRDLAARGASMETVIEGASDDAPEAIMVRQILAAVDEHARKVGAMRTKYAMLRRQKNGERMSKIPPYGWWADGDKLNKHAEEQAILHRMLRLARAGAGPSEIARRLNKRRLACRGGLWSRQTVGRILKRSGIAVA